MGCARIRAAPVQQVELNSDAHAVQPPRQLIDVSAPSTGPAPLELPTALPPSSSPEALESGNAEQVSKKQPLQLRQAAEVSCSPAPPLLQQKAGSGSSIVLVRDAASDTDRGCADRGAARNGTSESLYAQALQALQHGALPEDAVDEIDGAPNERLAMTMSCVRGSLGVTRLSFEKDDALLYTTTMFKDQCSPSAVKGNLFTWVRGEVLGRGSLGCVFCALEQAKGQVIAVKEVLINQNDRTDMVFKEALEHEISIIKELKHPHIVSYLGRDYVDSCLYIYLEYMPGGSLAQVLTQFGPFEESLIAVYTRELLEGLEYLHTRRPPVLHRDIKGSNVLVGLDCKVKLSDFGCSKRHTDMTMTRTMKGSIPWMAPEVILHTGYGSAADVWSLGCVVIEMATGKQPWAGKFDNPMTACYRIGMSDETPPVPALLSSICQDFLESCLRRESLVRLNATELLLHRFVEHLMDDAIERRDTQTYLDTAPDDPELLELCAAECVD